MVTLSQAADALSRARSAHGVARTGETLLRLLRAQEIPIMFQQKLETFLEVRIVLALAHVARQDRERGFDTDATDPRESVRGVEEGVCEDDAEATTYWSLNRDTPHEPAWR